MSYAKRDGIGGMADVRKHVLISDTDSQGNREES